MTSLRVLTFADWRAYRDARLASLADAPDAFGTTLAEAQALDEAGWRQRLGARTQWLASDADGGPLATVGLLAPEPDAPAEMVSLWVAPRARGRGLGDALVTAVLDHARAAGWLVVDAWVSAGNERAAQLYRRHGFVATARTQPIRPGHTACERLLRWTLPPTADLR